MSDRLKGKVAIVSGAGSVGPGWGNGKATSVLFAREGAKVFAVDINLTAAEETQKIISDEGGECFVSENDVSRSDQVKNMVAQCMERYGRIDILQNNVGIVQVGGPVETSEDQWDRLFTVNIKSMFLTCQQVLPIMERQRNGVIINVSSIASIRYTGYPSAAYSATKGAVNQLTQNIALQYAPKGIRANCVLPGLMNTPMIVEPLNAAYGSGGVDEMVRKRDSLVPLGKMGSAWDVAYASVFLASDEASYITGALLVVDGGLTCKFA
jgi:NAD(P)-dependent dehydrogenase (short-subunit alcohol dehydrogenase family)